MSQLHHLKSYLYRFPGGNGKGFSKYLAVIQSIKAL